MSINYLEQQNHFDSGRQYFDRIVEYYNYEKELTGLSQNPFIDEENIANAVDSYTAYYLGITLGDENEAFSGNNFLAWQEASAILLHAYQTCGGELPREMYDVPALLQ